MKRIISLLSIVALLVVPVARAQQTEPISITTLNVDGLPQTILVFNLNADGPGDAGTSRIGKYLKRKGTDIVCMQEDFNYHNVLVPWLEDDYHFDQWSGAVGIDLPDKKIDFLHAQNEQFACDGLGACWRNSIVETATERVAWKQSFGKFSHAADELVTKGFRRSELTLASGVRIIVYNMHMDAGDLADEKEGKDTKDREARLSQWQQLCEDVLAHLDTRPIIIVGDMNSYYCRDKIKAEFIDKIAASGKGIASDVWVELKRQGNYPDPKEGVVFTEDSANLLDGESLDKIIYINPSTGTKLQPHSFEMDTESYKHEDKPLGDHYPVSATFTILDDKTGVSTITQEAAVADTPLYYNLNGQPVTRPAKGLFIEHQGQENRKRIIK